MPTFATIIPNYNTAARIGEALDSLLGQTRPFDDILIVDDGSTDDSCAIIERLIAGKPTIRFIRNARNMGVVATLNRALPLITSDYVHMASANDTYSLRMLELCVKALKEQGDIALFCGNASFFYADTNRTRPVSMALDQTPHFISADAFHATVRRNPLTFFGGGIVMRHRSVMEAKALQEPLRWHCDWMLYYMLAFQYGAYFIPECLVHVEVSSESYSSNAMIWNRQRDVIHALITLLASDYPQMKQRWKSAALLPTYDLRALGLLWQPDCRWYVTPLLLWRLLIHSMAYRLKYFLPRTLLIRLRSLFRV
jgi:glycosyltransferase involved in cell wall biosynthesis